MERTKKYINLRKYFSKNVPDVSNIGQHPDRFRPQAPKAPTAPQNPQAHPMQPTPGSTSL